jgi:hypothetical protein
VYRRVYVFYKICTASARLELKKTALQRLERQKQGGARPVNVLKKAANIGGSERR